MILPDEQPRLCDIEAAVRFEAPRVQTDCQIVGEKIAAREIEVDQTGYLAVAEEDVVGKQIGMDDAARQSLRPGRFEESELVAEFGRETLLQFAGARGARFIKPAPAGHTQAVCPPTGEGAAGAMQRGEGAAEPGAMERLDAARPHAVEKGNDGRRPAAELAQRLAVTGSHRRRAGHTLMREMVHQRDKKW